MKRGFDQQSVEDARDALTVLTALALGICSLAWYAFT
jgi:hypothetical protein